MEDEIILKSEDISATFSYQTGFNLVSFKKGDVEVIHRSKEGFIGPHFGSRLPALIGKNEDPYPFGVARYLPWKTESSTNKINAEINGDEDNPEGQKFKITAIGEIIDGVLQTHYSVISDADSLVGSQLHIRLPDGEGSLTLDSREKYYLNGEYVKIPENWKRSADGFVILPLSAAFEGGFLPSINPLNGRILLKTKDIQIEVQYSSLSQESSWYIHRPQDGGYISIAALSSQNPWRPNLTVSSINMSLRIC